MLGSTCPCHRACSAVDDLLHHHGHSPPLQLRRAPQQTLQVHTEKINLNQHMLLQEQAPFPVFLSFRRRPRRSSLPPMACLALGGGELRESTGVWIVSRRRR
ncbi:hypothetical protein D1007_29189 [Hordeum vulgare]|nr:hypothetical protein D1007_29189 [Hordeum vulgare]